MWSCPSFWHRAWKSLGISWVMGVSFGAHNEALYTILEFMQTRWALWWLQRRVWPHTWLVGWNFQPRPPAEELEIDFSHQWPMIWPTMPSLWCLSRNTWTMRFGEASRLMNNTSMCWEDGAAREGMETLHHPHSRPCPLYFFHLAVLELYLI